MEKFLKIKKNLRLNFFYLKIELYTQKKNKMIIYYHSNTFQ